MVDNQRDIRTVSVFSGAGGLDIGAIEAGAHVIWANSATLPASMGGNKTPIIDENELYYQAEPWVDSYFESLGKDPKAPSMTVVPSYLRRITVAEAALIQTFPRGYQFQGSQSMKYMQIGNAVPCNLGKAVVKMVIDVLEGKAQMIHDA